MKNLLVGVGVYLTGYVVAWTVLWSVFLFLMPPNDGLDRNAPVRAYVVTMVSAPWPITLPLSIAGYIGYSIVSSR